MKDMLRTVITHEFMSRVGKFQVRQDTTPKAMLLSFRTELGPAEDGYRFFDVLIYAPENYVTVWTRTRWDVIPETDLEDDAESGEVYPKKGKGYVKGETVWQKIADHDSGWRDGVGRALSTAGLSGFSHVDGGGWYAVVEAAKYLTLDSYGYLVR